MSKCNKAKNPCKICLGSVSQKTGLKCQGACQSWVHYSCLNYTPGKIKDIRAGIIKVTCPCPDCKTTMPKEYRTDMPYSCNNQSCPANLPPKCDNYLCPINDGKSNSCNPRPQNCPLNKCGNDCKTYSTPQMPGNRNAAAPISPPCKKGGPKTRNDCCPGKQMPPGQQMPPGLGGMGYTAMSPVSSSEACLSDDNTKCPSGCSSGNNSMGGNYGVYHQSSGGGGSMPSFHAVEQMCNTVGELTNQINDLMCQMKNFCITIKEKAYKKANGNGNGRENGGGGCGKTKPPCETKGPRSLCPKPCFCPGNPTRR